MISKIAVLMLICLTACSGSPEPIEGFGPLGSKQSPIIGGVPTGNLAAHAAVVGLHRLTRRRGGSVYIYPFCSGVLITPTIVLTAGHCLDGAEDFAPTDDIKPNQLAIYVGDAPAELDDNGDPDILNGLNFVSELAIHPAYNKFALTDDIGIVRLQAPVTVTPVAALSPASGFTAADEGTLTLNLVGFGEDENGDFGVKLQADVTLDSILSSTQILHSHTPEGICFGDSGGPALLTRDSGATYLVGGVASWVSSPFCANTGAHTRVDAFEAFINDFVSPSDPPPPPGTCEELPVGASCVDASECCSNKCKGKSGSKTCK